MTDQPVTPNREALEAIAEAALRRERWNHPQQQASVAVDALLPLLTDALDRARQQGQQQADALIGGLWKAVKDDETEWVDANVIRLLLDRLARGADRNAPWDTALDVDPFTGQPDHPHGDSCDAEECCE